MAGGCGSCSRRSWCAWLHSPWPSSPAGGGCRRSQAWQSGALPYPVLLASQVLLAVWMAYAAAGVATGRTRPDRAVGRRFAAAAAVYAAVMVPRLVLGLTVARGHWWLDAPLPTVFHLVLMTFLAVYGHYHLRGHRIASRDRLRPAHDRTGRPGSSIRRR